MRYAGAALALAWILVSGASAEAMMPQVRDERYTEAFWKLYTAALRGEAQAQFQVGVIYERGMGVEKDEFLALNWYKKAAEQGHTDAQYNLALMYGSGRGTKKDEQIAMMWLATAARGGDGESRRLLLDFIDNKIGKKVAKVETPSDVGDEKPVPIKPVTLVCGEQAEVCSEYGGKGVCEPLKAKTVVTSTSKQGRYYKISGIIVNHRWKDYAKEGWVEEGSVEIRR